MTEYELIQMVEGLENLIHSQFEFWMATTFAAVLASYTAGNRLRITVRISIATLYLCTCIIFYSKYQSAVENVRVAFVALEAMNSIYVPGQITLGPLFRMFVTTGGSLLAIVLIVFPKIGATEDDTKSA